MGIEHLTIGLPAPAPLRLVETALFLDLDGTLAPLAPRPQDVVPDPRRTCLLEHLLDRLDGRLAVISGRTLADVDRILEQRVTTVAAVHGLVLRRPDGATSATPPHPALAEATTRLRAFAERDPGLMVEEKGLSVALHYRLCPQQADAAAACAAELAQASGLVLQVGHMVCELRTPGPDKGDSVETLLPLAPFSGARPVFVGDDATDEHGFEAVRAHGGFGVLVGLDRPTAAQFRVRNVEAVLDWLEAAS